MNVMVMNFMWSFTGRGRSRGRGRGRGRNFRTEGPPQAIAA